MFLVSIEEKKLIQVLFLQEITNLRAFFQKKIPYFHTSVPEETNFRRILHMRTHDKEFGLRISQDFSHKICCSRRPPDRFNIFNDIS